MQVSTEAFPGLRRLAYAYTLVFYLVCLLVFNGTSCTSAEFSIKQSVIVFLCSVCLIVMFLALLLEELAKRGKVDVFFANNAKLLALKPKQFLKKKPIPESGVQLDAPLTELDPAGTTVWEEQAGHESVHSIAASEAQLVARGH